MQVFCRLAFGERFRLFFLVVDIFIIYIVEVVLIVFHFVVLEIIFVELGGAVTLSVVEVLVLIVEFILILILVLIFFIEFGFIFAIVWFSQLWVTSCELIHREVRGIFKVMGLWHGILCKHVHFSNLGEQCSRLSFRLASGRSSISRASPENDFPRICDFRFICRELSTALWHSPYSP